MEIVDSNLAGIGLLGLLCLYGEEKLHFTRRDIL